MKHAMSSWIVGMAMLTAAAAPVVFAEESSKTLPTLLIKGEVVSLDTNDPTATLLKVKDRYGFETPIYLSQETKIARGDEVVNAADLAQGLVVEVEYNFDINTAKRHAVNVKVTSADTAGAATASAPPIAPIAPPAEAPAAPAVDAAMPATPEIAPAESAPVQPAEQPASEAISPDAGAAVPPSAGETANQ